MWIPSPDTLSATEIALLLAAGFAVLWAVGLLLMLALFSLAPPLGRMARRAGRLPRVSGVWGWVQTHFPKLSGFVEARLDLVHFKGLPLTLIAVAALYAALLFGGLIEEVLEAEEIEKVDRSIIEAVALWRRPELVDFFRNMTHAGDFIVLALITAITSGFLVVHGPRSYIVPLWVTIAGAEATTWGGKFLIARPRPEMSLGVVEASPAFPSGHATAAMAIYGLIAYIIARDMPGRWSRYSVAFVAAAVILLVAVSRVYLSVHFPSDIAAGLLVGTFWVLLGIVIAELLRKQLREMT